MDKIDAIIVSKAINIRKREQYGSLNLNNNNNNILVYISKM